MKFEPVTQYYNESMFEPMQQALKEIQEDGLFVEGFTLTKEGNKTKVYITLPQKESFLIRFGIKTGKLLTNS